MNLRIALISAAICVPLAIATAAASTTPASNDTGFENPALADDEAPVIQHDLSGPRLGVTFSPDGTARSQFGWHSEHQTGPGTRGPWLVIETVLLAGGFENHGFVPNGSLIFGLRLPNGFEVGVGPSVTIGGGEFWRSAVVIAAGRSFQIGGIRVPANVAVSTDRDGTRYSIITGWAIRDKRR